MEFFPSPLTREQSDAFADRIEAHWITHGFGLYAVDLKVGARDGRPADERQFIGYIGLARPSFEIDFTPCVEIGWRLDTDAWGRGLATEGARAVAEYALSMLGLDEIVSFTGVANARSRRVMEKIGMTHDLARRLRPSTPRRGSLAPPPRPLPPPPPGCALIVRNARAGLRCVGR